ncbi:MAG: hypothetical protein R3274_11505 [Desulfobacterales bacterium]|nr:hypothetical protein [Desulfobacterales bacterium]
MKTLLALIVMINLIACAAGPQPKDGPGHSGTTHQKALRTEPQASKPAGPAKSPHGYIIDKDYDLGRFGGFVGDCTDDQNWEHFWKCQSENSGNGGFN